MDELPTASTSVVRFGILGCAGIARKNVRAMHALDGVEAYAIGSRSLEKAQAFARDTKFGSNTKIYGSYQEVLDDPAVDVVYMPLPTALHVEWVEKAAVKGKHILLEKPPAMTVAEMDSILKVCTQGSVQLMDGTMWMHNPRAQEMKAVLDDYETFGKLSRINSSFFFCGDEDFHEMDIRVKPGLDGLGCLGDLGWYCIRAALWANDFELPEKVAAQPGAVKNKFGVVISCGATLLWRNGCIAQFDCGFDSHFRQSLVFAGTKAMVRMDDFCIPDRETVSCFMVSTNGGLTDIATRSSTEHSQREVIMPAPQEASMIASMAEIVRSIKHGSGAVDEKWPRMTWATQLVLNAVAESIETGGSEICLDSKFYPRN